MGDPAYQYNTPLFGIGGRVPPLEVHVFIKNPDFPTSGPQWLTIHTESFNPTQNWQEYEVNAKLEGLPA